MGKQLVDIVLPRLARPLYRNLEKYWVGELDDDQFTKKFEELLSRQHAWLSKKGVSEARAATAIHAALLILSKTGLNAEANEKELPLELVERRAILEAAEDVERNYGVSKAKVFRVISRVFSRYLSEE